MQILAIETSCDETSASVLSLDSKIIVKSLSTSSSLALHAKTGGIVPESAAREQVKYMIPVIVDSLWKSGHDKKTEYEEKFIFSQKILKDSIDAIAITVGPGLVGSLLVGVETAKTLSYIFDKPIIPVNHLLGHLYANFIDKVPSDIEFPFIGLIVSGGHTDLVLFTNHDTYKLLGGTLDDAAGEALDKVGRLLGLSYPAGPEIEKKASLATNPQIVFTSPLLHSQSYEFSFSGLKSEAQREIKKLTEDIKNPSQNILSDSTINSVCYALQKAVFDVLIKKTLKAAVEYNAKSILIGGGVAANQTLRAQFQSSILKDNLPINFFSPEKVYSTDNAAMIGAYALLHNHAETWKNIHANSELYL